MLTQSVLRGQTVSFDGTTSPHPEVRSLEGLQHVSPRLSRAQSAASR